LRSISIAQSAQNTPPRSSIASASKVAGMSLAECFHVAITVVFATIFAVFTS
jgi:hypothetical protein